MDFWILRDWMIMEHHHRPGGGRQQHSKRHKIWMLQHGSPSKNEKAREFCWYFMYIYEKASEKQHPATSRRLSYVSVWMAKMNLFRLPEYIIPDLERYPTRRRRRTHDDDDGPGSRLLASGTQKTPPSTLGASQATTNSSILKAW